MSSPPLSTTRNSRPHFTSLPPSKYIINPGVGFLYCTVICLQHFALHSHLRRLASGKSAIFARRNRARPDFTHLGTTDHLTSYSTTTRPRRPSPCTSPPSPSPWILFVPGKQQWDTGCRMQRDRRIPCITEMQYCLLMREKFADGLAGPTWRRRDWMKVCHSSLYSMSFIGPRKLP